MSPYNFPDTAFDLVGIAVSAGGLDALTKVIRALPETFPAAIIIVQHLSRDKPTLLPQLLQRVSSLPIRLAKRGETPKPGSIYIAPPDFHLKLTPYGTFTLSQSPLVNFARPAADPLLESVASVVGDRAIGVVLTGMGHDGAKGIQAIKQHGGVTIAQDEATSKFFSMPSAAIQTAAIDFVMPLNDIAAALTTLVNGKTIDNE